MLSRVPACAALLAAGVLSEATSFAQTAFDGCGQLVQGVECVLFESGDQLYVLDERGGFGRGDTLRVRGTLRADCASICQEGDGCIDVSEIGYCDGEVEICGALYQGVECLLLNDSRDGALYSLDDPGEFQAGDRVVVRGAFVRDCVSICQQGSGCVSVDSITAAPEEGCPHDNGSTVCPFFGFGLLTLSAVGLLRAVRRPG